MGFFARLLGKRGDPSVGSDDRPTAWPVTVAPDGTFQVRFRGSGFGATFEDDGETGYFYLTNETFDQIFDALLLYTHGTDGVLTPADEAFVVWSPSRQRAGFFYRNQFHAVFDLGEKRAGCRLGSPPPNERWCTSSHEWDERLVEGLR